MRYCFGVDVGGTTVKIGCFTEGGSLKEQWEIPTDTKENGKKILPDIAQAVVSYMEKQMLSHDQIMGIGLGVPGPVNEDGEVLKAVNLHWEKKHVVRELSELSGFSVRAVNDANAAALGEFHRHGGGKKWNVIFITLGTGVGGGVIVNGSVVAGAHGAAGEIGHACVETEETEHCNCGNFGCLEQMASATGIVRLAQQELKRSDEVSILRDGQLTAKAVFDACREGDRTAQRIVELFADYLGRALSNFTCLLDPDLILIGGGVSKAGEILLEKVRQSYQTYAFHACKNTEIALAQLGNDAGIYGAAQLILSGSN